MNQAMAVMVNDSNLGFAAPIDAVPQTPKWQSILTAIGTAIPTVVGTYNATRQVPQPVPVAQPAPQPRADSSYEEPSTSPTGVSANVGFDLNKGLNIGGIQIPILFLALGGVGLYLLFKEPPKRGR